MNGLDYKLHGFIDNIFRSKKQRCMFRILFDNKCSKTKTRDLCFILFRIFIFMLADMEVVLSKETHTYLSSRTLTFLPKSKQKILN